MTSTYKRDMMLWGLHAIYYQFEKQEYIFSSIEF